MQLLPLFSHAALCLLLPSCGVDAAPPQPKPETALEQRGINPVIPGYAYHGCFNVIYYTFGKAIQAGVSGGSDTMTVQKCAAICWGYSYFGVEYGRECLCGWQVEIGHSSVPDSNCDMPCAGDATQSCGAGGHTNVYKRTVESPEYLPAPPVTSYASKGCYTEGTSGRALSSGTFYSDVMNVETCAIACEGFDYFGLQYYRECFCGNVLNTGSVPALASQCNTPCLGQGADMCGGNSRLNVYEYSTPHSPIPTGTPTPPTNLINDGSFEGPPATYGNPTAWTIITDTGPSTNYTLDTADTTLPHSGTNALSLGYTQNTIMSLDRIFAQSVTLLPNRRYKLTSWSRGAGAPYQLDSSFCEASYSLVKAGGSPASSHLYTKSRLDELAWSQSLAYFTNKDGLTGVRLEVRVTCIAGSYGPRYAPVGGFKFYFDDVRLELVPEGKNFIA